MRKLIFVLMATALVGMAPFARAQSLASESPEERAVRLRKELLTPPTNTPEGHRLLANTDFVRPRVDEIRALVRSEALRLLGAGTSTPKEFTAKISPLMERDWEVPPTALTGSINGQDYFILAYYIHHTSVALPDATAIIEGFTRVNGIWQSTSRTGENLANTIVRIEALPSPWGTEAWFLAHGQQTRVMQYTEKAAIYSYDGRNFKLLWASVPIGRPRFTVEKDSLKVRYEDPTLQRDDLEFTVMLIPGGPVEVGRVVQH